MSTEPKYVMGVDTFRFGEEFVGSICVFTKGTFEYIRTIHSEAEYESEIKKVAEYYSIPENKISTETK